MSTSLETIEISPACRANASIIWLHGLGADGHDFEAMPAELQLPDDIAPRFIFPHAPYRPITLNNGYVMRGWYDIASLSFNQQQDETGILDSVAAIAALIQDEIRQGIPAHRIVLAGFSQGGAIALYAGLTSPDPLAGILALSTYVPLTGQLDQGRPLQTDMPVFMAHGTADDIVRYEYGVNSRLWLEKHGIRPEWHDYPMGHSLNFDELRDIRGWLVKRLTDATAT